MSPSQPSLPPDTTAQQDMTTAGQRRVNLIWEYTQSVIALMVFGAGVFAALWGMIHNTEVSAFLAGICGTVTGFYFGRTNHEKIGGIGSKPDANYSGR
jgi:hypothetical protein